MTESLPADVTTPMEVIQAGPSNSGPPHGPVEVATPQVTKSTSAKLTSASKSASSSHKSSSAHKSSSHSSSSHSSSSSSSASLADSINSLTSSLQANFTQLTANLDTMNSNILQLVEACVGDEQYETVDQYSISDSGHEHSALNANIFPGSTWPNETTSIPVASQTAKAKFFDKLLQSAGGKEPLGPTIDNSLTDTINKIVRSKPDDTFDKDIFKGILQPGNCPGLSKITVNPSVWDRIPAEARTQDVKLQRVHNSMIKAASSFSYVLNTLLENMSEDDCTLSLSPENMESLLDKSSQAWSCFGSANFELVARRREALRPHIASDFGHLCAQKTPYTDFLFGDVVTT